MERCKIIEYWYNPIDTRQTKGRKKEIKKYLEKGYRLQRDKAGNLIFTRGIGVRALIEKDGVKKEFGIRSAILNYYDKREMSLSLFEGFRDDFESGNVHLYMDEEGYRTIKSAVQIEHQA